MLEFLYYIDLNTNTYIIRDNLNRFYGNLKEIEKILNSCENSKIKNNDCTSLYRLFYFIGRFVEEYHDGFEHEDKILKKRFNKVAKKLESVVESSLS